MLDEPQLTTVIRGLRNGNRDAWAALYDAYSAVVWRFVSRLLGNRPAEIADVVKETFLAAAQAAGRYDPQRGLLQSWLLGIAHHQTSLHWRKAERRNKLAALAAADAGSLGRWLDGHTSQNGSHHPTDVADLVRYLMTQISSDYAELLVAKYMDERSLDDLANAELTSVEAVKSKLARARREFRQALDRLQLDPRELVCE